MRPLRSIGILIGFIVLAMGITASAETPDTQISSQVNFSRLEHGQYVVNAYINDQGPFNFMVDTAATRSSLFRRTANKLRISVPNETQRENQRMVNGIIISKERPIVSVQSLRFANIEKTNHHMIILEDWADGYAKLDGILGMDMMDGLVLVFKHKETTLSVANNSKSLRKSYRNWTRTKLNRNPYGVTDYGLRFTQTNIQGRNVPTIIDLGAAFSAINWQALRDPKIKKLKSNLREQWKIQGAVGTFIPTARIRINYLEVGNMNSKNNMLIVMNLDNLPVNKFGKEPLMLMGTDFIGGRDFALDFASDQLFVKKGKSVKKGAVIDTVYPTRFKKRERSP